MLRAFFCHTLTLAALTQTAVPDACVDTCICHPGCAKRVHVRAWVGNSGKHNLQAAMCAQWLVQKTDREDFYVEIKSSNAFGVCWLLTQEYLRQKYNFVLMYECMDMQPISTWIARQEGSRCFVFLHWESSIWGDGKRVGVSNKYPWTQVLWQTGS